MNDENKDRMRLLFMLHHNVTLSAVELEKAFPDRVLVWVEASISILCSKYGYTVTMIDDRPGREMPSRSAVCWVRSSRAWQ